MHLEELQARWQGLDQKLDRSLALETELLRRVVMQPARQRLNRLAIWPAIDVVFSLGVMLFAGSFLGNHWPAASLCVPAVVVMAGALALLIMSIRQLEKINALDWSGAVGEIQASLQRLQLLKIQQFKWTILLSPLVGFSAAIVGFSWFFESVTQGRLHILEKVDSRWVVANYVFGVLFIPAGHLAARMLADRYQGRDWWKSLLDQLSGQTLKSAVRELDQWTSLRGEQGLPTD